MEKVNALKWFLSVGMIIVLVGTTITIVTKDGSNEINGRANTASEKVYVALEGEGKIAIVDPVAKKALKTIDLTEETPAGPIRYMAHNVQVARGGSVVLVTANVKEDMRMEGSIPHDTQGSHFDMRDQLVVIDPESDEITARIPLEVDAHLAHVVVVADGSKAYVTLQERGYLYVVDIVRASVASRIDLGNQSGPHGLRLTPNEKQLVVALLDGKAVAFIDTDTFAIRKVDLGGFAVQTAVTQDGAYAFVSIFDKKQVAWFSLTGSDRGIIELPHGSQGPVQIYSTPDSRHLYVADQGYYFDQPPGNLIYRIDIARRSVDQVIEGGEAPHGIVINGAGTRAYVTNLLGNDLSIIDVLSGKEVGRISVGNMPNGVSVWNGIGGGTP